MITVKDAIELLEVIFLDEFKSSGMDKASRPDVILDIHRYFKYQTRVYTFSVDQHIPKIYNDLRTGRVSEETVTDSVDVSYPLLFLTELAQRLMIGLVGLDSDEKITTEVALNIIASELAETLTLHTFEQTYITDAHYQDSFDVEQWTEILEYNPWLLVGALLRYTSVVLTEDLYMAYGNIQELGKEVKDK